MMKKRLGWAGPKHAFAPVAAALLALVAFASSVVHAQTIAPLSENSGPRSRIVAGSGESAMDCVQLVQFADSDARTSGDNRVLINQCSGTVEVFWCHLDGPFGNDCDRSGAIGNAVTLGVGNRWPLSANGEVRWGACHGANSGGFATGQAGLRVICTGPPDRGAAVPTESQTEEPSSSTIMAGVEPANLAMDISTLTARCAAERANAAHAIYGEGATAEQIAQLDASIANAGIATADAVSLRLSLQDAANAPSPGSAAQRAGEGYENCLYRERLRQLDPNGVIPSATPSIFATLPRRDGSAGTALLSDSLNASGRNERQAQISADAAQRAGAHDEMWAAILQAATIGVQVYSAQQQAEAAYRAQAAAAQAQAAARAQATAQAQAVARAQAAAQAQAAQQAQAASPAGSSSEQCQGGATTYVDIQGLLLACGTAN